MWSLDLGELLGGGSQAPSLVPSSKSFQQTSKFIAAPHVPLTEKAEEESTSSAWVATSIVPCPLSDVAGVSCTVPELSAVYQFRTWKPTKRHRGGEQDNTPLASEGAVNEWRPNFLSALSTLQHHPQWYTMIHQHNGSTNTNSPFMVALNALVEHMVTAPSTLFAPQTITLIAQLLFHHLAPPAHQHNSSPRIASVSHVPDISVESLFAKISWRRFQASMMWKPAGSVFYLPDSTKCDSHHRETTALTSALITCWEEQQQSSTDQSSVSPSRLFLASLVKETGQSSDKNPSQGKSDLFEFPFLHDALTTSFLFPFIVAEHNENRHDRLSNRNVFALETEGQTIPLHLAVLLDAFLTH